MIQAIGTDLIEINRIKRSIDRYGVRFIERVFTEEESAYCYDQVHPPQHFAGRFCAKESVMKVLGTGWEEGIRWKDIEIQLNDAGKPIIHLYGNASQRAEEQNISEVHISISHADNHAQAFAIGERPERK